MNKCDYCMNDCRCTSSQRRACIESDYQSFQMFEEPKEIRFDNRWAVCGFDFPRASLIIEGIEKDCGKEVLRRIVGRYLGIKVIFKDGTILQWVPASNRSRGHKFGKMWCDKNINEDILCDVVMPCYCGKREDIIWI